MKGPQGFLIEISETGLIQNVRRDDFKLLTVGKPLSVLIDGMSLSKFLTFLSEIKKGETAISWEINFKIKNQFQSLFVSGFQEGAKMIVIGSTDNEQNQIMYNELMKISNQQTNQLRTVIKEKTVAQSSLLDTQNTFDELTSMNNQMLNMQRKLSKQNHVLKSLNDELELKNRELDQFAYIVTHDLKAPLRGIASLVDMINEDFSQEMDNDLKGMFHLIKSRANRMDDLISSILNYSRAGKIDGEKSEFELSLMIGEIIDSLAIDSKKKFSIQGEQPKLHCSYVQLSQVLTNLIGNAFKYHDKVDGEVLLKISDKGNYFLFEVVDNGPGIPEIYHQKVFGVFETANNESRADSTGVGLAIVKKLVLANGGDIGLKSTEGEGSNFWFTWKKNEKK